MPLLTPEGLVRDLNRRFAELWSLTDKVAEVLGRSVGTLWFLLLNAALFAAWIAVNLGWLAGYGVLPFDSFPFGLLTLAVSLEAIFLSIIVLMTQNKEAKAADIRQKMDFEIDVKAGHEVTKVLNLLDGLYRHFNIPRPKDKE